MSKSVPVIPRSQASGLYPFQFRIQTLSKVGGWVDSVAADDLDIIVEHAEYLQGRGEVVRVIDNFL